MFLAEIWVIARERLSEARDHLLHFYLVVSYTIESDGRGPILEFAGWVHMIAS